MLKNNLLRTFMTFSGQNGLDLDHICWVTAVPTFECIFRCCYLQKRLHFFDVLQVLRITDDLELRFARYGIWIWTCNGMFILNTSRTGPASNWVSSQLSTPASSASSMFSAAPGTKYQGANRPQVWSSARWELRPLLLVIFLHREMRPAFPAL